MGQWAVVQDPRTVSLTLLSRHANDAHGARVPILSNLRLERMTAAVARCSMFMR